MCIRVVWTEYFAIRFLIEFSSTTNKKTYEKANDDDHPDNKPQMQDSSIGFNE